MSGFRLHVLGANRFVILSSCHDPDTVRTYVQRRYVQPLRRQLSKSRRFMRTLEHNVVRVPREKWRHPQRKSQIRSPNTVMPVAGVFIRLCVQSLKPIGRLHAGDFRCRAKDISERACLKQLKCAR